MSEEDTTPTTATVAEAVTPTNTSNEVITTPGSSTGDGMYLKRFLSSMRLNSDISDPVPMLSNNLETVVEDIREEDRFISGIAAVLMNIDATAGRFDKGAVQKLIAHIDELVNTQLNQIIHNESFKKMEADWSALNDLVRTTNFKADVMIDILDVGNMAKLYR